MSSELPELPPEPYVPESGELRAGDVCAAVALPDIEDEQLFTSADAPGRLLTPVKISYVVVLAVYEGYATVAPVALPEAVQDREALQALVDSSPYERRWLRLPPLRGEWEGDAVALFFLAQTLSAETLLERRAASMREREAHLLAGRFAVAFGDDGE